MMQRRMFLGGLGAGALAGPALAQTPPAAVPPGAIPSAAAPPSPAPAPAPLPPVAAGMTRVNLTTAQGVIVIDLAADKAPLTVANFLRYVDRKAFDGANFYRAVKVADTPLFGLLQGGLKNNPAKLMKPIAHESTTQTGLSHKDGTISMARAGVGTATADFFICIGDASDSLDANPKGAGDNLGFAAFGMVVQGMDVARKILVEPTSPTAGGPGMAGTMLLAPVPFLTVRRA